MGSAAGFDSACERRLPALEQRLAATRPSPGLGLFPGRAFQLGLALEEPVALAVIATALLDPFEPAIFAANFIGLVLIETSVHARLAGGLA